MRVRPFRALTEQALRLRSDATFAVLEGFHALKHALRFGAEVELVLAADPDGLDALAQRLAPDVRAQIAARARPVPRRPSRRSARTRCPPE